ncbi:hypothetical protein ACFPOG_30655 [Paenibacillus aestuarii]|uniref:DUF4829 domain-containing protein n=1 Tax=Paenibacillus aestuarii TaxID=516965 RepID=A0ABW0KGZ3_9BACL
MRKTHLALVIVILLNIMFLIYILNLRSQLQDHAAQVEAIKANEHFIEQFFTYTSTKKRYENIKPLMTADGYKSTFPSGLELPETDNALDSKVEDFKPYGEQTEGKASFINDFKVTTTFNKVSNTQGILVKTYLIKTASGWMVDDVEFIGNLGQGRK